MVNDLRDDILADLSYEEELLENKIKNICDDCEPVIDRLPLEHHGTPCWLEQVICEPGENNCQKARDYKELQRILAEVQTAQEKIENKKVREVA